MSSSCAKHHPLHPEVGVCASCLRERLANCVSTLRAFGEEEDGSIEGNLKISPIPSDRALSYYLEGVYSKCNVHASHKKAMSSDGGYEENSCYGSNYYVRNEGGYLKGGKGSLLCEKGRPSSSSWLSTWFLKRGGKHKAESREGAIASWRDRSNFESGGCEGASPLTWDAPRPSSWEQLSSWEKPSSSPLKLASLLNLQSPSSPLMLPPLLHSSTRSPLKLPPLQRHSHSPRSSLKLSPLLSSQPPLKLPSLLGSHPTIASTQVCPVSSQIETNQRCGHAAQSRKKKVWFRVFLRNKWTVKFKRHFAEKEAPDSARTSSVKESDYLRHSQNHYSIQARHSQNHCFKEKNHCQNQQFSILNRSSSRAGRELLAASVSGRDYGAWESYYSPVHSQSFNGVQGRHRYNSCVQRRESAELLRFYLAPLSLRCKIR